MASPRPRRYLFAALVPLPVLLAVARVLTADVPPRRSPLTPEVAAEIAARLADAEPAARARARLSFPGDRWSQDDDFHNHERRLVTSLAARHGVDRATVLGLLDADLRSRRVLGRVAGAAPCKPRPFYE